MPIVPEAEWAYSREALNAPNHPVNGAISYHFERYIAGCIVMARPGMCSRKICGDSCRGLYYMAIHSIHYHTN
eukprot:9403793-Karenia_brevis.AAC.1